MEQDRNEGEGRAGLGAGVGGSTGGTLGGGERQAMGQGAGAGREGDLPGIGAAEADDRTPDPVRDSAVARVSDDQLRASPRPDDADPADRR